MTSDVVRYLEYLEAILDKSAFEELYVLMMPTHKLRSEFILIWKIMRLSDYCIQKSFTISQT